jgi:hypothetical protein
MARAHGLHPFLTSCFPAFKIRSVEPNVIRVNAPAWLTGYSRLPPEWTILGQGIQFALPEHRAAGRR